MALALLIRVGLTRMKDDRDNILTVKEVAEFLKLSTRTVKRMIQRNDLPAFKVGGQWRVSESRLAEWLRGRENTSDIARRPQGLNGQPPEISDRS